MKSLLRSLFMGSLWMWAMCPMPVSAQTLAASPGPVTVVVKVTLTPRTMPTEALAALRDMRALMKKQPGYLSEELLQNLNPDNSLRYVHVSRWADMVYWAALFRTPDFSQLNAHGNEHYTIATSAFLAAE